MGKDGHSSPAVGSVALVCAPDLLRLGLERVLGRAQGIEVHAYERMPERLEPPAHVAVLCERDLGDAARACERARERVAREVVLVFAQPDVHLMLDCVAAGAAGFVVEGDGPEELTAAVLAAAQSEHFVTPALLGPLLEMHRAERAGPRDREHRLLELLAGGRSTAEIADALGVAPKTVRNRSSLLYRRLGVRSRAKAIEVAERRGLLD
jgi:DNA-binding NarL/FixJ family response regulator